MTCFAMAFFPPNFMLRNPHGDDEEDHPQPTSLHSILSSSTLEHFHGVSSYFEKRALMPLSKIDICHEVNGEDELWDDGIQVGEKKRRLNREQVKTLEKSFEMGNKLEPARKMELARALGLQPRQIAIWFQNRRARWKIKQLERDYNLLKRQLEAVRADNHALQAHNHQLHAEIVALKSNREPTESINLNKETEGWCSENSSHIKLEISTTIDNSPSSNNHQSRGPLFLSSPPHHNPSSGIPHNNIDDQTVKEQSLSNMYIGIDDQSGFWPWLEQQHFN